MESLRLQGREEEKARGQEMRVSALPAAANGNGRTGGSGDGRQQAFARGSTPAAASSGGSNSFQQHMLAAGGEWLSDEIGKEQRDGARRFVVGVRCVRVLCEWCVGIGVRTFFFGVK